MHDLANVIRILEKKRRSATWKLTGTCLSAGDIDAGDRCAASPRTGEICAIWAIATLFSGFILGDRVDELCDARFSWKARLILYPGSPGEIGAATESEFSPEAALLCLLSRVVKLSELCSMGTFAIACSFNPIRCWHADSRLLLPLKYANLLVFGLGFI